jgi:hypothetical protein
MRRIWLLAGLVYSLFCQAVRVRCQGKVAFFERVPQYNRLDINTRRGNQLFTHVIMGAVASPDEQAMNNSNKSCSQSL